MNAAKNALPRRAFLKAGLSLLFTAGCEGKPMRVFLNISLFNYLDRPIFGVKMNGTSFMAAPARGFYGANSVMVMQPLALGVQHVTWRLDGPEGTPRNGETVAAKNSPVLKDVPKGVKWLALHIYPDDTVEIKFSAGTRDELQAERGKKIIETWESQNPAINSPSAAFARNKSQLRRGT